MKICLLLLNIIFCFSHILDEIRIDLVNKGIAYLPPRENVDLLKMANEISKIKDQYSMTEAETAYFIFKWISRKLGYDCYGENHGGIITEPLETYREGRGGDEGLARLFTTICGLLNIESQVIFGIEKYITYNFENPVEIREKYWNSVMINDSYYLVDIMGGMGYCSGDQFNYPIHFGNYDFGLNPESFIRHKFPNDNKWQLISNPITKAVFNSMAYLYDDFFKLFKTIYPDVLILRNGNELVKITLTFENPISIDNLEVTAKFYYHWGEEYIEEYINIINLKIANGALEFSPYITKSGFLTIYLSLNSSFYYLVTYLVDL